MRLLLAVALLAGCKGAQPKPDAAVPAHSAQAHRELRRAETGASGPELAPEAEYVKAKVLEKDVVKGCTWLESQGLVTAGEQDSRHQVRAAAIAEAEKNAMQDFLGVEVKSRFMDFQQEGLRHEESLTESLLQTTRLGRLVDEQVLQDGYRDVPGCPQCRFAVRLKACIMPLPDTGDKDFRVELGLSRTKFVEGDKAKLTLTATRDCWAYVYDVDPDKSTALIVPNDIVPEIKLKAGQAFEYPSDALVQRGVTLEAQLPQGVNVSAETIRVIASKTPLQLKLEDPAVGGYLSLLRRLNASRLDWTDDAQAFTIFKR